MPVRDAREGEIVVALMHSDAPVITAAYARDLASELRGHRRLHGLYDFWAGRRGRRPVPLRRDLDIVDMRPWIGHLNMVAVALDPPRFRYLVYGGRIAELVGRDLTGRDVSANPASLVGPVRESFATALRLQQPFYQVCDFETPWRRCRLHRLVLPLAVENGRIDRLLVGVYETEPRRAGGA